MTDLVVHLLLDVLQLFGIDVREMRKVKAQALGRVQRAGLLYVRAQNVSQGRMHQMRSRVIADDARAALGVGLRRKRGRLRAAFPLRRLCARRVPRRVVRAGDFGERLPAPDRVVERAGVGHLAAGLGINYGAVEHDFAGFAGFQFVDWPGSCLGSLRCAHLSPKSRDKNPSPS